MMKVVDVSSTQPSKEITPKPQSVDSNSSAQSLATQQSRWEIVGDFQFGKAHAISQTFSPTSPRMDRPADWQVLETLLRTAGDGAASPKLDALCNLTCRFYRAALSDQEQARSMAYACTPEDKRALALLWDQAGLNEIRASLGGWVIPFTVTQIVRFEGRIRDYRYANVETFAAKHGMVTESGRFSRELTSDADLPDNILSERNLRIAELIANIGVVREMPELCLESLVNAHRKSAKERGGAPALAPEMLKGLTVELVSGGGLRHSRGYLQRVGGSFNPRSLGDPSMRLTGTGSFDGPIGIVLSLAGVPLAVTSVFPEDRETLSLVQIQRAIKGHHTPAATASADQSVVKRVHEKQLPVLPAIRWEQLLVDVVRHYAALEGFKTVRMPDASTDNIARFSGRAASPSVLRRYYDDVAQSHGAFTRDNSGTAFVAPAQRFSSWDIQSLQFSEGQQSPVAYKRRLVA